MRRVTGIKRDDSGAATVFIVIAMTLMLIAAGFAIDVGQYVVAARSAQNTSDATVLAVATDCALSGAPIADYSPYRKPGQTISTPACGSGEATITTTKTVDGLLLNISAGDVDRSATAKWGTIGQATTVPLVISDCEFTQALLDAEDAVVTLYLDDPNPHSGCSSLPGGFSQLDDDDCEVLITAGGDADGKSGGDLNNAVPCITPLPLDILIPLYDASACTECNGNGSYPIAGFAMFRLTGYSFNGVFFDGTLGKKCPDNDPQSKCLRGDFIKYTTSQGGPGPSTNFGLTTVYLSD